MITQITLPREKIAEFCRRHHIRQLAIFGSALRNDFRPDSDLDVLVKFEPLHMPGLAFFAMEAEVSQIFGRRVDLNTTGFLSKHFRKQAVEQAFVIYEQA